MFLFQALDDLRLKCGYLHQTNMPKYAKYTYQQIREDFDKQDQTSMFKFKILDMLVGFS